MQTQYLVVVLLVSGSSLYALWVLLPTVARRFVARQLLQLPLAQWLKASLLRAASTSSGCDCTGCDKVVGALRHGKIQPLRFHSRPKR